MTYHAAAGVAGVLQVTMEQFGCSVLEGFGQSSQEHGEFWGVELKQSDEDYLSCLKVQNAGKGGMAVQREQLVSWFQK